jgi:hypothetical protein
LVADLWQTNRHCEERSDKAMTRFFKLLNSGLLRLLRFARNDEHKNLISTLFKQQNNLSRAKDNTHRQPYYLIFIRFPHPCGMHRSVEILPQQRLRAEQRRFFKSSAATRT